jgi:hypothetical protein
VGRGWGREGSLPAFNQQLRLVFTEGISEQSVFQETVRDQGSLLLAV